MVAVELLRHREEQLAGADDLEDATVRLYGSHFGNDGQQGGVERCGRAEPEPLSVLGLPDETRRCVEGDKVPSVNYRQPVAEPLDLLHEVGDEDHRYAAGADVLDEVPYVATCLRIKPGGEFVEDDDLRISNQCERYGEALFLPAGQMPILHSDLVGEPEGADQLTSVQRFAVKGTVEVECLSDRELAG